MYCTEIFSVVIAYRATKPQFSTAPVVAGFNSPLATWQWQLPGFNPARINQ